MREWAMRALPSLVFAGLFVSICLQSSCTSDVTIETGGSGGATTSTASKSSTGSTATSMQTTTTQSTSTGMTKNSGDCDSSADCPPNGQCVELTPGGFRVCQYPVPEATSCTDPMNDECCGSAECSAGSKCYPGPLVPSCGGPQIIPHNQCGSDFCSPGSCPSGVCAPSGTVNNAVATCIAAGCLLDADCKAHAGGICATWVEPCCNGTAGLACIYPGLNCRTSADCNDGSFCGLDATGSPTCMPGFPACPA